MKQPKFTHFNLSFKDKNNENGPLCVVFSYKSTPEGYLEGFAPPDTEETLRLSHAELKADLKNSSANSDINYEMKLDAEENMHSTLHPIRRLP